ncbi:hypothetical protein [Halostella salina]|uniref:hypothetical protein n=1 Tax=Halostella salina TaxID=1547897 RepID=UPI001F08DFD9|nr:hypothetical protein [Halostella salina]
MSVSKRKSADWMLALDERILEQIEADGWTTPGLLSKDPKFPEYEGVISDRCKRLHYAELLDPIHNEMYEITVEGRLYLKGELDARHRPRPTASAVHERWSFPSSWTGSMWLGR